MSSSAGLPAPRVPRSALPPRASRAARICIVLAFLPVFAGGSCAAQLTEKHAGIGIWTATSLVSVIAGMTAGFTAVRLAREGEKTGVTISVWAAIIGILSPFAGALIALGAQK